MNILKTVGITIIGLFLLSCKPHSHYQNISGFAQHTNQEIQQFLKRTRHFKGRKVAVFDMDGTVMGQAPYYLADESLYQYALKHPDQKPKLIQIMVKQSNTSKPYVANRVHYFAGMTPQELINLGNATFQQKYQHKFFPAIQQLIHTLQRHGFEVWVVSASPEFVYQGFVSQALGIPVTHVIGIKSVVKNGITTDEIIPPIAQADGKVDAIATRIKAQPLFAAGNSKDDIEMLQYSKDLRMIVNPDTPLKAYAKAHHWLIAHTQDLPTPHAQYASQSFHIRINASHTLKPAK
jgi:phosphoserine phosphatase